MHPLGEYLLAKSMTAEAAGSTMFSEPEIRLCEALNRHGRIAFRQQVAFITGGKTIIADFVVDLRLVVEVDGKAFHDSRKDFRRDISLKQSHGLWTLRLPASLVMKDADACVSMIALRLSELREWFPDAPLVEEAA